MTNSNPGNNLCEARLYSFRSRDSSLNYYISARVADLPETSRSQVRKGEIALDVPADFLRSYKRNEQTNGRVITYALGRHCLVLEDLPDDDTPPEILKQLKKGEVLKKVSPDFVGRYKGKTTHVGEICSDLIGGVYGTNAISKNPPKRKRKPKR